MGDHAVLVEEFEGHLGLLSPQVHVIFPMPQDTDWDSCSRALAAMAPQNEK